MPTDAQSLMLFAIAACVLPVLLGRLLAPRLGRPAAVFALAALAGLGVALWLGAKAGLLAATWSLALAWLGTSRGFLPASLGDVAGQVKDSRRWWS